MAAGRGNPSSTSKLKSRPRAYTVLYDSESHWSVLTQMNGSSWPRVFPYCLFNVILMLVLTYVNKWHGGIDSIHISDQGHTFVTMVMSFLLVSRVTMALARYSEARNHIGAMFRGARKYYLVPETSRGNNMDYAGQQVVLLGTLDYPVVGAALKHTIYATQRTHATCNMRSSHISPIPFNFQLSTITKIRTIIND